MALLGVFGVAVLIWLLAGTWMLIQAARHPRGGAAGRALAAGLPMDLDAAGLCGATWLLRVRGGVDLEVLDIQGQGNGPVTILIHDWAEAPLTMLPRAAELAGEASRIVMPTLRGHGGGACSLGPREIEDLGLLLDTLNEGGITIEAGGFGACVATGHAADDRVAALALHDPWRDRPDGLRRILAARGIPAWPIAWLAAVVWPVRPVRACADASSR